eukprot:g1249.t1
MSDWWATVSQGIAGLPAPAPGATGPVPPDSVNLWDALVSGAPSPRTEVLHLPLPNRYVNTTLDGDGKNCTKGGCSPSMRAGDFKIVMGWPGEDGLCHLKPPLAQPVPYGQSKGKVTQGDHCEGGHWDAQFTHQNASCVPYCLFDVKRDPSESNDLSGSAAHRDVAQQLLQRLGEVSRTGVAVPELCNKTEYKRRFGAVRCAVAEQTGFWLPLDFVPTAPTPPPPAPPAPPAPTPTPTAPPACAVAIDKACPAAKFADSKSCRKCCSQNRDALKEFGCRPKYDTAVCNARGGVLVV